MTLDLDVTLIGGETYMHTDDVSRLLGNAGDFVNAAKVLESAKALKDSLNEETP